MRRQPNQAVPRGGFLLELVVAIAVTALILSLVVPLFIRTHKGTQAMAAQARCVAAAREAASQLRRDVQRAASVRVSADRLVLGITEPEGTTRVTWAKEQRGWVRRCRLAAGREGAPLWLREEVRRMAFAREGRAIEATVECADPNGTSRTRPVILEVFAVPRNGGL